MKEFKKYFFETLIQLAILANVFRENGRYSIRDAVSSSNGRSYLGRVFQTIELNSTRGNLDYLFLNDNISNDRYSQYSQELDSDFNSSDFSMENSNYINKETDAYINDMRFLRRLNSRSSNTNSRSQVGNMNNFLFVAPASFSYNNNNQKELNRLSETRLLFNSIEQQQQSNNQFNKEDFEMDIDIQTIIQQDIDLGIEKSLCYDIDVLSQNNEKGLFVPNKDAIKNDFFKDTQQQIENQKNMDILTATDFFQNQMPIQEGYKLVLEEDTGELFLMLLNGNDGSNKTNAGNISLPIRVDEHNEIVNSTENKNKNLTRIQSEKENTEECIDIKCNCSIFLNDDVVDEIFKIDQMLDSELHHTSILTPPRSDEDYFSRSSNEEIEHDNLNSSSSSSSNSSAGSSDEHSGNHSPKFLSLVSVNRELSKLNESINQNVNEMVLDNPLNLQSNETSRIDELLLFNETWIKNNFPFDPMFNSNENTNHEQRQVYALDNNQLNSQINYINNNQSLQLMNNAESVLKTQGEQFDFLYSDQETFVQETNTTNLGLCHPTVTQNTSIDSLLLDEDFLKNIEENIQNYENKNENEMTSFGSFDFLLNDEPIKHEQINMGKSSRESQLISDNTNTSHLTLDSNLNINVNLDNDEAKNKATNSSFSTLNNFDIILLKQEKTEPRNEPFIEAKEPKTVLKTNRTLAMQGLMHNHTYLNGAESQSDSYHPYSYKNKLKKMLRNMRNQNENQDGRAARAFESRDEIMLREKNIYFTLSQVVESNAEEFNELLKENSSLTQEQINLIKDIRRRGKNKVAAQICRKRKIDSIDSLKEDVEQLNEMKSILNTEYELIHKEIQEMTNKFDILYKDTIGSSVESDDPILVFINNLKSQLNTATFSGREKQQLNSEDSDSHGYDDSYGENDESYLNGDDDDEEDEDDFDDIDDDEKSQVKSNSVKKFKKF